MGLVDEDMVVLENSTDGVETRGSEKFGGEGMVSIVACSVAFYAAYEHKVVHSNLDFWQRVKQSDICFRWLGPKTRVSLVGAYVPPRLDLILHVYLQELPLPEFAPQRTEVTAYTAITCPPFLLDCSDKR